MARKAGDWRVVALLGALLVLSLVAITVLSSQRAAAAEEGAFEGPVPRADCGPGSRVESALQGQVPKAERDSGQSKLGTRCNLELVGQFQGEGSSWVSQSYRDCAYMSVRFPNESESPGVQVIDVSDPAKPTRAGTLTSPAMQGTWETLKVNEARGLLAAVSAPSPAGNGVAFFDVYDIAEDCRKPRLLNSAEVPGLSAPANGVGHEGNWSPDGRTYWATSLNAATITAIDVSDPARPRPVFTGRTGSTNHGFGLSADGNRLYMVEAGGASSALGGAEATDGVNGLRIFDSSEVQARKQDAEIRELGTVFWTDGAVGQHVIPVTYGGRPYLVYVDELGSGAARIIDIGDESRPRIVSKLKLEIQMPNRERERQEDTEGNGLFGYDAHYCDVDRQTDPTALACGYFQSGVRLFDIREVSRPREIAYFNPPAQTGRNAELPSSEHAQNPATATFGSGGSDDASAALNTDWCSSPPRFVGSDQLWVACQDNGFMTLRITNGAFPLIGRGDAGREETGTARDLGLPPAGACTSRRNFGIRLRAPRGSKLRSARVYVAGKRVKVRRSRGRLRARVDLRGQPKRIVRVRIVATTTREKTVRRSRAYRTCTPSGRR